MLLRCKKQERMKENSLIDPITKQKIYIKQNVDQKALSQHS